MHFSFILKYAQSMLCIFQSKSWVHACLYFWTQEALFNMAYQPINPLVCKNSEVCMLCSVTRLARLQYVEV